MDPNQFKCSFEGCFSSYKVEKNLKNHIKAYHRDTKQFSCNICGKGLSSRQILKDHYNLHSGEKPYNCRVKGCQATFRQLSKYSAHKQIHKAISNQMMEFKVVDM